MLLALAGTHCGTILALHTHTQPAQPSTVAHYLLAAIEQLERDHARLAAAYETTNRCPLGACAITGTGFPIDRQLTSDLLGFDAPTGNTYGSIASVDYLLQNVTAAAVLLTGLGRLVQDLLTWCTAEVGYLRLGDGFVQGSSIMPQKRNPVALEHARALCSKALGEAVGVIVAVHNTPFGDIVDTEDDLQPLVEHLFRDAGRAVALVSAAMATASFDAIRLEARAGCGGITLTELADTLVREQGIGFQAAHAVASRIARALEAEPSCDVSAALSAASAELTGRAVEYPEARLREIMGPRHFVEVRTTPGGPAPAVTAAAIDDGPQQRRQRTGAGSRAGAPPCRPRPTRACESGARRYERTRRRSSPGGRRRTSRRLRDRRGTYIAVVLLEELVVVGALWALGRYFTG